MKSISEIYDQAKVNYAGCVKGTLTIEEAKSTCAKLWDNLFLLYEEGSQNWRIVDKARKDHTDWWSVSTMSNYASDTDANNFKHIFLTIEKITDKSPRQLDVSIQKKRKEFSSPKVTGRTSWDFLSELHREYGIVFIVVGILLLLTVIYFDLI